MPPGAFRRGFGDAPAQIGSPLQPPSAVLMPSSVSTPNTMGYSPEQDFFDPTRDGTDIMFYDTTFATLAPAGSTSSQIQIDSGVDFYWFATTYQTDIAQATLTESSNIMPLITVVINDTGSRKNLMNSPLPVTAIMGPGERPYRLVRPRLFRASSTINFTWVNYASGTTYADFHCTFHGYTKPKQS
jgi:hypothetical protein